MSAVVAASSKIGGVILALGVMILASALVAFVVARRFGRGRRQQRAIYSAVGAAGLLALALVAQLLLRR